jgi:hypothetical protein
MKLPNLALTISALTPLARASSVLKARQMDAALPDCFRICFAEAVSNNVSLLIVVVAVRVLMRWK